MEKTININIQDEANVNAVGTHVNHCSKPVICIETGDVYASLTDAAHAIGVTLTNMSCHLTGKSRSVKGKHFCYLSRATESLDAIVTRLRETSTMEEDARKWRAYQAEQEAIRKAEEKRIADERKAKEMHEANIQKAINKIQRRHKMLERAKQQVNDIMNRIMEAEKEYEALTGKPYVEENCEMEEEVA